MAKAFAYVYHVGIITFPSQYALKPPEWAFALNIGRQRAPRVYVLSGCSAVLG